MAIGLYDADFRNSPYHRRQLVKCSVGLVATRKAKREAECVSPRFYREDALLLSIGYVDITSRAVGTYTYALKLGVYRDMHKKARIARDSIITKRISVSDASHREKFLGEAERMKKAT